MPVEKLTSKILKKAYKKRDPWCHKYDYGHLLVIGGSKLYSGSPAFNALAALRAGVDLVTVVAPRRAADIIASFKPDLITYPLDCDYFSSKQLNEVLSLVEGKTAVVIGGGMCRNEETLQFIRSFLSAVNLPVVVDADAIHAVAKHMELVEGKPVVFTPHAYEFFVLTGKKVGNVLSERVKAVEEFAKQWKVTLVLKGHVDVISNGERTALNYTGSPKLTVGGTGDTLAGILGALLARGVNCFDAACAATWLNGKAGELAVKRYGEGMIASDLIEVIPLALKKYLKLF